MRNLLPAVFCHWGSRAEEVQLCALRRQRHPILVLILVLILNLILILYLVLILIFKLILIKIVVVKDVYKLMPLQN